MPLYQLFGFCVETDLALPGIRPISGSDQRRPVIHIVLGAPLNSWPIDSANASGRFIFSDTDADADLKVDFFVSDRLSRLVYGDGCLFLVSGDGKRVWGHWPTAMTLEDLCTYLLGPIFRLILRLHGHLALHAGAVVIDGKATLFVGPG